MQSNYRLNMLKKLLKVLLSLLLLVSILMLAGFIWQEYSLSRDKKNHPYPGQLVTINGRNMHLQVQGKAVTGIPTIVLIGGLGATSPTWTYIQSQLKNSTRVVSFDRPGYGWSDASNQPRDGKTIARELHDMLEKAGIAGPYVIVAHSLGGLYGRIFASEYAAETAGLVLIESTHPDQFTRTAAGRNELQSILKNLGIARVAAKFGFMRLNNMCKLPLAFPEKEAGDIQSFCAGNTNWQTEYDEMKIIPITMQQAKNATLPAGMPILAISAGNHLKADSTWGIFQQELSGLTTHTKATVLPAANHVSVWTNFDDASKTAVLIAAFITKNG